MIEAFTTFATTIESLCRTVWIGWPIILASIVRGGCLSRMFYIAGLGVEMPALILRTPAPLNRDIVRAGMTSCVADTSRMKREVLPTVAYPTIEQGISLL